MSEANEGQENVAKYKKPSPSKGKSEKPSNIKRKAKSATKKGHKKEQAKNKEDHGLQQTIPEEQKTYNVHEENGMLVVEIGMLSQEPNPELQAPSIEDHNITPPEVPPEPLSDPKLVDIPAPVPAKKSKDASKSKKKKIGKRIGPEPIASLKLPHTKSVNTEKAEPLPPQPIQKVMTPALELERKEAMLAQLKKSRQECLDDLSRLREQIGKKLPTSAEETHRAHWDYLLKEMEWMAKDFDRERKSKAGNAKKLVRANAKFMSERQILAERYEKQKKQEVKRNANTIAKMVQHYWKSIDKIIKHNYYVWYEYKKQQAREKRLNNFVSKHLKLSEKVAKELKSKTGMYPVYNNQEEESKQEAVVEKELPENEEEGKYNIRAIAERAAEIAKSAQPTGFTLSTSKVSVKVPFLLKHPLREYQIIGLDWLATLHDKRLNGILADEMGLGKTIQTIALLASLAVEKGIWGPHLIVVPTTIIINWEMEFKKWCPAFKVLTYFGSQRERKQKRSGWSKPNAFHICITSYKLVIQDHFAFRRKKWYYMVLDEAQNIKNFRSQRWQLLLRFNTKRRLLLTGTPLQNDVMELWSLMHFLMPQIFASHEDFKEWFYNPFAQSINSNAALNIAVVQNLQSILRPFLLRRLKKDVEKQLPEKVEHIVYCNLSRRQRFLYDEYINCERTQKTLQNNSDFFSIMNVLMQLRKVCNHPDLFESRHIDSPFTMRSYIDYVVPSVALKARDYQPMENVNFGVMQLLLTHISSSMSQLESMQLNELLPARFLTEGMQQIFQYPRWAYSYYPTKEGLATPEKFKAGNLLLKKPNVSGKEFPTHPLMGSYSSLPSYLSLTNVPYLSSEFSLNSTHELYKSVYRPTSQSYKRPENDPSRVYHYFSKMPYCYYSYKNCLTDLEQILESTEQLEHLKTLREHDYLNRLHILNSKPIFGKDLRKAVKVQSLVSNLYQKPVKYCTGEVPSAIFNSIAQCSKRMDNQSVCQCEDLENNDVPQNCAVVLECSNKKTERKKAKKIPSFKFDPSTTTEFDKFFGEYANEEKKLVITIDLDYLNGTSQKQESEAPLEEENKTNIVKIPFNAEPVQEEEVKMHEEPDFPSEVPLEQPVRPLEEKKEEEKEEEEVERTENSFISEGSSISGSYESEDYSQKPHENLMSEISENSKSVMSDDNNSQEENYGEIGRYLTRSKKRNLETKPSEPAMPYNGVTVELIPTRFLDALDNQNENGPEEPEELKEPLQTEEEIKADQGKFFAYRYTETLKDLIKQPNQRQKEMNTTLRQFKVIQPKTLGLGVKLWPTSYSTIYRNEDSFFNVAYQRLMNTHFVQRALRIGNFLTFPDRKLIQYDSGKLQKMSILLKKLRAQNSKVLIFTQMSKMLDIIECFLNLHGYTYVRLDGSIKVETRQAIVDRFNNDPRVFCFISSTRCGGIGINLTAADAVIFYDSDWNPAMDKQAQDRCHRIGQTKTVHIYRLITLNTIEENIFKKSLQKREIGGLIMEDGQFDTDFFKKIDFKEVVEEEHLIKRPKPTNILEKENIRVDFMSDDKEDGKGKDEEEQNPKLMKKLEDALIVVEDKEDVEAAEKAKKEIEDEFEFNEHEDQPEQAAGQAQAQQETQVKQVSRRGEESEFKKNELIDWENDESLLSVTRKSLEFYQKLHPFDEFYSIRSASDKRFIPEVDEEEEEENQDNSASDSESVISDTECDELPESIKVEAMQAYEETRKEIVQQEALQEQMQVEP